MRFQTKAVQVNELNQNLTSDCLNSITHDVFKFLTDDTNKQLKNSSENEKMQYLEDCANATRGTEAYDQYEWLDSDE